VALVDSQIDAYWLVGDKFDAAAVKYETCRLAIRDGLLARLEVVSCPAAAVSTPPWCS